MEMVPESACWLARRAVGLAAVLSSGCAALPFRPLPFCDAKSAYKMGLCHMGPCNVHCRKLRRQHGETDRLLLRQLRGVPALCHTWAHQAISFAWLSSVPPSAASPRPSDGSDINRHARVSVTARWSASSGPFAFQAVFLCVRAFCMYKNVVFLGIVLRRMGPQNKKCSCLLWAPFDEKCQHKCGLERCSHIHIDAQHRLVTPVRCTTATFD